nr:MAG TPA: hypothetical protein [Caudoviricetes sp.]
MNAERAFSCVKGAGDIKGIQNCRPPRLHTASGTATSGYHIKKSTTAFCRSILAFGTSTAARCFLHASALLVMASSLPRCHT